MDKETATGFAAVVLVIVAILGLTWIVQGNDFFLMKHFAPKYEAARREGFEQSKAFNQGTAQELRSYQIEYVKADKGHQDALRKIILHQVADYPEEKLPKDLQEFVGQLKREEGLSK